MVFAFLMLSIVCASSAFGQTFEVASIRPSPPFDGSNGPITVGPRGGPGTQDPARYTCNFCDISDLVSQAYEVPDYRIASRNRLPEERFHIVATVPPRATRAQFLLMIQNLLSHRFGLKIHREQREMQMFRLLTAAGGLKAKPHVEGEPGETRTEPRSRVPGHTYKVRGKTVADFAKVIEGQLRAPVADATGDTGKYDFDVWWTMSDVDGGDGPAQHTLLSAIQSLGLRLDRQKGQVEVVVVDSVNPSPTEN